MPGKLINNTLSSLSSGVSQQYQEGRFDSQVDEMINCMPSITRGVLRRNPVEAIRDLSELPVDISTSFVYSYDRGTGTEQYIIVIPGDGYIHTFNANDGTHLYTNSVLDAYLVAGVGSEAKKTFKAMTVGDHTFIVNTTITTAFTADIASSTGYSDMAFYWIKKTASVTTNQYQTGTDPVQSGSLMQGYTYQLNGTLIRGTEDTRPTFTQIDLNTSDKIAAEFVVNSAFSLATSSEGSICYDETFVGTDWVWEDSFGSEASLGVWKTVKDSDDLPVSLPLDLDGFKVKVAGSTSSEFDDYYLEYSYTNKTWNEIPSPGKKYKLDADTMPHVLYRLSASWKFTTYQGVLADGSDVNGISEWGEREAGGDNTLDDPSFVGTTLTNIFFHKNRLGFITSDNIVLSQTGAYGDFFFQTLQDTLDDDPIDLAVASKDVTVLRHAVSTAGQLIIFSDDTQFSIQSLEGPLTPTSADITPLSNYTYGKDTEAASIGNRVYFTNQVGRYSQLYAYTVADRGSQITEANNMSIHLPTYIDASTVKITGHDVLGYIFIEEETLPKELIVLTTITKNNEDLQNAFHKWVFDRNIVSTHIINNDLYILFEDSNLIKMALDIPGSIADVTYLDEYNTIEGTMSYISSIDFSEFFYRDKNGKGSVRGRYQLRTLEYTIEELSKYVTYIANKASSVFDSDTMYGPTWGDTDVWDDTLIWADIDPLYTREYEDDAKVTVMSESKQVEITFRSSVTSPSEGFELATANIEGYFHQRSTRV